MAWLNGASIVLAVAAAALWFASAAAKTPDRFSVHVVRADGPMGEPLGGNPLGGIYVGQAHSNDFAALAAALKRQSKLSAWGAVCAGASALLQAAVLAL